MEDNLTALEAVLASLDEPPVRARSGEEAMKAPLRQPIALVLLGIRMPGMDGFETAAHIKRLGQTGDAPIIFLTGADDESGFAFRGYATGAADYLTKPFDPWVLRAEVSVFLDLYRKGREAVRLCAEVQDLRRRVEQATQGRGAVSTCGSAAGRDGPQRARSRHTARTTLTPRETRRTSPRSDACTPAPQRAASASGSG